MNLVASTLINGASASLAMRRASSVLPTPVGPIIKMFLGVISSRSSFGTSWRRYRLRSATASARFAFGWPTIYLSSSCTIWRGVNDSSFFSSIGASFFIRSRWQHRRIDRCVIRLPIGPNLDLLASNHSGKVSKMMLSFV